MDTPIVGYNVIEAITRMDVNTCNADIAAAFSDIQCETEQFVHLIRSTLPGALCSIKTVKRDVIVPKKERINITCRAS